MLMRKNEQSVVNSYLFVVGAICTFPVDLLGVWISTYNGPMVFDTSEILGYTTNIPNAPKMELNCLERNDNFYILK